MSVTALTTVYRTALPEPILKPRLLTSSNVMFSDLIASSMNIIFIGPLTAARIFLSVLRVRSRIPFFLTQLRAMETISAPASS